MSKSSEINQRNFIAKTKSYKELADSLLEQEKLFLTEIKITPQTAPLKYFSLANEMLNLTSYYLVIDGVSKSIFQNNDMEALGAARKSVYKSIVYLETISSPLVDVPFSDYEEKLAGIASVNAGQRFFLAKKMGLTLELLKNAYGKNSKWRWFFVELEGRYAAVIKNIIDLRSAAGPQEPGSPDYEPMIYHVRLAKKSLMEAADSYHEKYEFSGNNITDLAMGIRFLAALRRFNAMLGDKEGAEIAKKKHDVWVTKYEYNLKKN